MKKVLLVLFWLFTIGEVRATLPVGKYLCPISYTERTVTAEINTDGFPTRYENLDQVRIISGNLQIQFSEGNVHQEPKAKILNPQLLPNFLFVTEKHFDNQTSLLHHFPEDGEAIYQIDWNDTWYFGSTVQLFLGSEQGKKSININIVFDDNDGWTIERYGVNCSKIE